MSKPTHLPQIDALRGIAALVVALIFHQYYLTGDRGHGPLDQYWGFEWLYRHGWTMVDLFFVISGYIMCHVYLSVDRAPPGAARFVLARFARLYPLHLVTLLATAVVLSLGTPVGYASYEVPDAWNFALNLLMLQQTPFADGMSFNAPSWSIAVEIYCYAVFYLIVRFARRWLPWLALAIMAAAILAAIPDGSLSRHIARGFCGFFTGVILWRWGRFVPTFVAVLVPVPALWLYADVQVLNKGCYLSLTLFPACVLLALRTRLLVGPVFAWLGTRSYAIYLVSGPIYWAASLVFFGGAEVNEHAAGFHLLACFAVILVTAHLSYRYLEDPARRWLRGLSAPHPQPSSAMA